MTRFARPLDDPGTIETRSSGADDKKGSRGARVARLIGAVGLLMLTLVLYWLLTDDGFRVRPADVTVDGIRLADAAAVREQVSGLDRGPNVFRLRAIDIVEDMASLPEVAFARASVTLPADVIVEVVEREPIFIWSNGGDAWFVDADGVLYSPRDETAFAAAVAAARERIDADVIAVGGAVEEGNEDGADADGGSNGTEGARGEGAGGDDANADEAPTGEPRGASDTPDGEAGSEDGEGGSEGTGDLDDITDTDDIDSTEVAIDEEPAPGPGSAASGSAAERPTAEADAALVALPILEDARIPEDALSAGDRLPAIDFAVMRQLLGITPAFIGSESTGLRLRIDQNDGYVLESEEPSWQAVFGHYRANVQPPTIVPRQAQCLTALFATKRERRIDRVVLAPNAENCGSFVTVRRRGPDA